jgi:hypothetical protein
LSAARARALRSRRPATVAGELMSVRNATSARNFRTRDAFWPKSNFP